MAVVLGIILMIAEILLIEVHLVKFIGHTTEQTEDLPEIGATRRVKGQRCMPVILSVIANVV
jgi:hypothetical protein